MPAREIVQPCGSRAAYRRHLDRQEVPDEACVLANRRYVAAYRRAAQGAAEEQTMLFQRLIGILAGLLQEAS